MDSIRRRGTRFLAAPLAAVALWVASPSSAAGAVDLGQPFVVAHKHSPASVAIADFNHDGNADIANADSYAISVVLGRGHGRFGSEREYRAHSGPQQVLAADLNRDR